MEIWAKHFLAIAILASTIALFVPAQLKLQSWHWLPRALARLPFSFAVMAVVGAFLALLAHIPTHNAFKAIANNPKGGTAYFFEVGFETGALWLPVLVVTVAVLAVREARRG